MAESIASKEEISTRNFVAPSSEVVPLIRRWIRTTLRDMDAEDKTVDAQQIASELVTNAARVAGDREICVAVRRNADGSIVLVVRDPDPRGPALGLDPLADLDNDNPDCNGGRGLFIVGALARRWGWNPDRTGGKEVWAVL